MPVTISDRKKYTLYGLQDCQDKMFESFHKGKVKGSTTHIADVDKCWTWRKQEFNLWTGYMNEGKSQWLRYLSLIKMLMDGWTFLFCAPEDFPPEEFYDDMIHTLIGLPTDKAHQNQMPEDLYIRGAEIIKRGILFLYMEPGSTIADTLNAFGEVMKETKIDAAIIDPLIKFSRPKDLSDRDDIYAQHITTICTDFCRRRDISLHMVLHQLTPRLLENGYYPKPSAYQIKGGGTWSDGSDNVLTVWRPEYAKDKVSNMVRFASTKIKKQKLVGIPQEFEMKFDRRSNRYVNSINERDLFDFDEVMRKYMK